MNFESKKKYTITYTALDSVVDKLNDSFIYQALGKNKNQYACCYTHSRNHTVTTKTLSVQEPPGEDESD